MTTSMPKRINPGWISQAKTRLACVSKASPDHAELAAEIAQAEASLAEWNAFASWVKKELGAIPNQFPLRTAAKTYEVGEVFLKKADGKTTFWTVESAWSKYENRGA